MRLIPRFKWFGYIINSKGELDVIRETMNINVERKRGKISPKK